VAVEQIFEKWRRLIEEGSQDLRWVIVERDTLIYLSKHSGAFISSVWKLVRYSISSPAAEIRRKFDAFQMIDPRGIRRTDIALDDLPWLN
jgi:hypothetical protein